MVRRWFRSQAHQDDVRKPVLSRGKPRGRVWSWWVLLAASGMLVVVAWGGRAIVSRERAAVEQAVHNELPRRVAHIQSDRFRLDLDIETFLKAPDERRRVALIHRARRFSADILGVAVTFGWRPAGVIPTAELMALSHIADEVADAARLLPEAMPRLLEAQAALREADHGVEEAVSGGFNTRAAEIGREFERLETAQAILMTLLGALVILIVSLAAVLMRQNRRVTGLFARALDTEVRMQLALEAASAGWWFRDENDVITAPPETFELCGLDWSDTLTIAKWTSNVLVEDRAALVDAVMRSRQETSAIIRHRFRISHPVRGIRWIYLVSRPITNAEGQQVGAHGLLIDDTEGILLEEDLLKAKERADQAVAAKSRMLAAASHDLRQPLQSMFLFLSALEAEVDPKRREEVIRQLGFGMTALKSLLDSLVEVARLEGGTTEAKPKDIRLDHLLGEVGGNYLPRAEEKGLELSVEAAPILVHTDPAMLGRMIRNLLENAVRYTMTGQIRLSGSSRDGVAFVEVSDTGVGIPEAHRELVWEEFHQVGNKERDRGQGLGLGLAIVRSLGRLLGHRVTMESKEGRGTTFRIELPLSAPQAKTSGEDDAPHARVVETGPIPKDPVVVIDDDVLLLKGMETIIAGHGYHVIAAPSGDSAAAAVTHSGEQPFLIIADYRLRNGETGVRAILKVRDAARAQVPAMVLTGEVGEGPAKDAEAHGIGLFEKPMPPRKLMAHVARAAAGKHPATA